MQWRGSFVLRGEDDKVTFLPFALLSSILSLLPHPLLKPPRHLPPSLHLLSAFKKKSTTIAAFVVFLFILSFSHLFRK